MRVRLNARGALELVVASVGLSLGVLTEATYAMIVFIAYADEQGIDLIVMGTHGRSGVERLLLGSVTERVLRASDVPVLVVRAADNGTDEQSIGGQRSESDENDKSDVSADDRSTAPSRSIIMPSRRLASRRSCGD